MAVRPSFAGAVVRAAAYGPVDLADVPAGDLAGSFPHALAACSSPDEFHVVVRRRPYCWAFLGTEMFGGPISVSRFGFVYTYIG